MDIPAPNQPEPNTPEPIKLKMKSDHDLLVHITIQLSVMMNQLEAVLKEITTHGGRHE